MRDNTKHQQAQRRNKDFSTSIKVRTQERSSTRQTCQDLLKLERVPARNLALQDAAITNRILWHLLKPGLLRDENGTVPGIHPALQEGYYFLVERFLLEDDRLVLLDFETVR